MPGWLISPEVILEKLKDIFLALQPESQTPTSG